MLTLPLLAAPAFAQQTSSGIPEIVVTAQRKSESVLAVPMSIQAISGDSLQNSGVKNMTDLQMTTPGYLAADSSGYTQVFIRGVGNNIFVGADPSVATYIDDVPRIFGIMVSNFVNTERVEVLKGAQGGLYGRNATGGVINIITKKPSTEKFSVSGHVGGGSFNTFDLAAYVNVPFNENVALAVAGQRTIHDGYYKNFGATTNPYTAANFPSGSFLGTPAQTAAFFNQGVKPQASYGNGNFWAIDTKLLVKAGDNFKATLAVDYNEKKDDMGSQLYDTSPAYQSAVLQGTFLAIAGIQANIPSNFVKGAGPKFTVSSGQKNDVPLLDGGASLTLSYSAPTFDLTSISAYRFNRTTFTQDLSAGSVPVVGVAPTTNNRHVYYQELRAVSTGTGPFSWLGGATYLQSWVQNKVFLDLLPPLVNSTANSNSIGRVKNWSVYLQAGYNITDDLNVTVSGRYVHETNNATFIVPAGGPASLPVQNKFLPSATISYKVLDGTLYARWARGYKAGGINPLVFPGAIPDPYQGSLFRGEQMDTFEAGYRASLFERRVQVTSAIFYNNQKNPQVTEHANPSHPELILAITNAKSARQYGAEAAVTWRVIDPLTVGVSAGYLNAKFKDYKITDATLLVPHDASGKVMPNSPKLQISLSADLDQPISDKLRLVGNLLVTHVAKTTWLYSGDNNVFLPDVGDPGYWLTNARIGVRLADDSIGVSVYANNLFNARYTTFGSSSAAAGNLLNWGVPRVIGGQVDFKF
jgi:iron complex outermembrane receptor protein